MDLVQRIYRPLTTRASRRVVVGRLRDRRAAERRRFTPGDVDRVHNAAWRRYDVSAPHLAEQPTLGSAMNVRLACFTLSFFEELMAAGVERAYAIELVADASWSIYRVWTGSPRLPRDLRQGPSPRSRSR